MAEVESKPQSPSTPSSANGVDSKKCPTRILRTREGEGEDLKTEDFEVPVVFLKALGDMGLKSEDGHVFRTDDNVIELDPSIASIKALVDWITRENGFTINERNWESLTTLSREYKIDSLHKDITTWTHTLITKRRTPTVKLWKYAARYGYRDLAAYCLEDDRVLLMLKEIIQTVPASRFGRPDTRPEMMESILEGGYTEAAVGDMIRKIVGEKDTTLYSYCMGKKNWCKPPFRGNLCDKCRKWFEFGT